MEATAPDLPLVVLKLTNSVAGVDGWRRGVRLAVCALPRVGLYKAGVSSFLFLVAVDSSFDRAARFLPPYIQ